MSFFSRLYVQVLIGIAAGVLLGALAPEWGAAMRPLGDGFIKLIKMLIAPIVFCTIVAGIGKMADMKGVGSIGLKALIYFEVVSTAALLIGLGVGLVVRPGSGIHASAATLDPQAVKTYVAESQSLHLVDFLLNVIPTTIAQAFVAGDILQILLVSVLFGLATLKLGQFASPLLHVIDQLGAVLFGMVGLIVRLAPIGAFGAMAFTIGRYGVATLFSLAKLMAAVYLTCLLFVIIVLGVIAATCGFSLWKFIRYIKEEILLVLGTSSSESALPRMMSKLEYLGCDRSVVGLVIPTGYSFNLDGTSIYMTIAVAFVAQALDVQLAWRGLPDAPRRAHADVEGRRRRHRGRIHHARRDAGVHVHAADRRPHAPHRGRPLHVRGTRDHESDRERRGDDGRRALGGSPRSAASVADSGRRPRSGTKPSPPRQRPSCQLPKPESQAHEPRSTDLQEQLSRRRAALEISMRARGIRERVGRPDLKGQAAGLQEAHDVANPPEQLLPVGKMVSEARPRHEQRATLVERRRVDRRDWPAGLAHKRHQPARPNDTFNPFSKVVRPTES